jgi:hypothetical protein
MAQYTRLMQKGIYALIYDISFYTGYSAPAMEIYFKRVYWGEREGQLSLSLAKCAYYDAVGFFNYLVEFALEFNVPLCSWSDSRFKQRGLLDWGFPESTVKDTCHRRGISAVNFRPFE